LILLVLDIFLSLNSTFVSIALKVARVILSSWVGLTRDKLDFVGFIMGELEADETKDDLEGVLTGVLTNSCLDREIALPEDRPMSLLAGLLPGVSLEVQ